MDDIRTELLVTGYIRDISPLRFDLLSLEVVNGINKWNSTTYRLPNTFMIAFVDKETETRPRFMPYSIEDHLSVKQLILTVLRLNNKTGDKLHNIYKLWKWQYVVYKNQKTHNKNIKNYSNFNNYPRLGWRGWAYLRNSRLIRDKLSYKEYYWISIDHPQYRSQGSIARTDRHRFADKWLYDDSSTLSAPPPSSSELDISLNIKTKMKGQKHRIIQYFNNYEYWWQQQLTQKINAVSLSDKQIELLVNGYIRIHCIKSKLPPYDIIDLCLKWYILKRDCWDIDNVNLKLCKINTISNTICARAQVGHRYITLIYQGYGSMTVSKKITKKKWKLTFFNYDNWDHGEKFDYMADYFQNAPSAENTYYVGITSQFDSTKELEFRNNPNCFVISCRMRANDVITINYETINMNNQYRGQLSFEINNKLKEVKYIEIANGEIYKLFTEWTSPRCAIQLIQ